MLSLPNENIICVTMPGFGTTDMTYNNAVELIKALNTTFKEIDIKPACLRHMSDIGHDSDIHDITYENTQARERTQILMDISNKVGGILVGTGDLSELALGWCTYNADHMSMYGVNCSVPKTLVRHLVRFEAEKLGGEIEQILLRVLATPVSPELLPPDENGNIKQKPRISSVRTRFTISIFTTSCVSALNRKSCCLWHLVLFRVSIQRSSSKSGSGFYQKIFHKPV